MKTFRTCCTCARPLSSHADVHFGPQGGQEHPSLYRGGDDHRLLRAHHQPYRHPSCPTLQLCCSIFVHVWSLALAVRRLLVDGSSGHYDLEFLGTLTVTEVRLVKAIFEYVIFTKPSYVP